MLHERSALDEAAATPLGDIRAIADSNLRAGRQVFERASLAYLLVIIWIFSVAFLHDARTAKLGLILSSPFVAATVLTAAIIFRGLPTRIGVWMMLLLTNAVTTIVTIVMGGLAYHSLPLLFFTFCLAAGFLTIRDTYYAMLTSLGCLLIVAGVTLSEDPLAQINAVGVIDPGQSYLVSYLSLVMAFTLAAWINSDAKRAQERRVVAALKRAEHASAERTSFFSMISHELRTPLNGLIGLSEVLTATGASDAAQARARTISSEARKLAQSSEQVLDMVEKGSDGIAAPHDYNDPATKGRNRNSEVRAIIFAGFFVAMLAATFLYDPARAQIGLLASSPFAACVLATPFLVRRGMSGQVSIRILSWSTLGADCRNLHRNGWAGHSSGAYHPCVAWHRLYAKRHSRHCLDQSGLRCCGADNSCVHQRCRTGYRRANSGASEP